MTADGAEATVGPGLGAVLLASVGPAAAYACNVAEYGPPALPGGGG